MKMNFGIIIPKYQLVARKQNKGETDVNKWKQNSQLCGGR